MPQRVAPETACRSAYERALASVSLASMSKEDVEWFARTRELVLRGELRDLAVADLRRYRELAANVGRRFDTARAGPVLIHSLPHSYSQFGSFAGVA